jgi:hypothetical protein
MGYSIQMRNTLKRKHFAVELYEDHDQLINILLPLNQDIFLPSGQP